EVLDGGMGLVGDDRHQRGPGGDPDSAWLLERAVRGTGRRARRTIIADEARPAVAGVAARRPAGRPGTGAAAHAARGAARAAAEAVVVACWAVRSSSSRWPSLERDGSWIGLRSWPATMPTRSPFFCARKQIMPAARIIASRLEVPSPAVAAIAEEVSTTIERCRTRSSLSCRISGSPERAVAFQSMSEILSPGW